MMNLSQFVGLLRGRNPQELVMSMLKNNNINDPTINQLVSYAQNGDMDSLTKTAQTIFAQQGRDFNAELNSFMQLFK